MGNLVVGCTVRLKSNGEDKVVTAVDEYSADYSSKDHIKVQGSDSKIKPSEFEWESQVPAFCAGVAASQSLTSVSDFSCMY